MEDQMKDAVEGLSGVYCFEKLFDEIPNEEKKEYEYYAELAEEKRKKIASEMLGKDVTDETKVSYDFVLQVEDKYYSRENALVKPSDMHRKHAIITPGINTGDLLGECLNGVIAKATEIIEEYTAENSKKAFDGDLVYWRAWIKANNLSLDNPITKEVVIAFIMQHVEEMPHEIDETLVKNGYKSKKGTHKISTVERRLASMSRYLQIKKRQNPLRDKDIGVLMFKLKQKHSGKRSRKQAITRDILDDFLDTCGSSLIDIRDRAILLFGWASGGRRRSEIVDAKVENLNETPEGDFTYRLGKTKTDKEGYGCDVPIKGRAAKALKDWLKASKVLEGSLFRSIAKNGEIRGGLSGIDINRIVKKRARLAHYEEERFGAHSLRSGFVTEAGKKGKPIGDIMAMTTHKSIATAMDYYQSGAILNNSAANLAD